MVEPLVFAGADPVFGFEDLTEMELVAKSQSYGDGIHFHIRKILHVSPRLGQDAFGDKAMDGGTVFVLKNHLGRSFADAEVVSNLLVGQKLFRRENVIVYILR
jgi:hypothetical protein